MPQLLLGRCRQRLPQPVYSYRCRQPHRRTADVPQTQTTATTTSTTTTTTIYHVTDSPQTYRKLSHYRQPPYYRRTADAPIMVVMVGGKGVGPCYFSTLNIWCIGELVFIPYTRQPREKFPIGVGLRNEVRPYKIPVS